MSARLQDPSLPSGPDAGWRSMTVDRLDAVCAIEQAAYPFPWTRGNFIDSLAAGYLAELHSPPPQGEPIGYYVAMFGADELHLLNLTVAPSRQRQGHGRRMLERVVERARDGGAATLWLEVRASNAPAIALYRQRGFARVGLRRGYYPAASGREDAIVMSLPLAEAAE